MEINKAIEYFMTSLHHAQLSKHTIRAYAQDLHQWVDTLTKKDLENLTFEDFQLYFMNLQISELKITSLRRKRIVIHRFLKFCYQKKLTSQKLYEYIDPIKTKKNNTPKEVLSREEIHKIFSYLRETQGRYISKVGSEHYEYLYYCSVRNELIISILLYTGCRIAEVVALKKQDIDIENNYLIILAKGQKYNRLPIHENLLKALMTYKEQLRMLEISSIKDTLEESIYMFPSKKDNKMHLSTRTVHELMLKLSEIIGRHIHAHLFRHTFASYCIASNMDIATISSLISHSNPSITLSIYTHEIESNQKQQEIKKLTFNID